MKTKVNQNIKEEEIVDKQEDVIEIKPINNLKLMKVIEKILTKEVEVMIKDMIVEVAKILKGLKYNIMFVKGIDVTPLNIIIMVISKFY